MSEVPESVKKMLNKYGDKFKEIFDTTFGQFVGKLWVVGIADFDLVKFDKYMETRRSYDKRDISLADFVEKRYGKRGKELVEELINMEV